MNIPDVARFCYHGHILSTETEAKYLGVTITLDLLWNSHITDVCNKAKKILFFLRCNIKITSVVEAAKLGIQGICTTCAGVCQPCLGSLHSQQHQGTGKGSETGSKMGERGLQKISVCGHHARITALANTRAAEKASTHHYLLQVSPRFHPQPFKIQPLTKQPL